MTKSQRLIDETANNWIIIKFIEESEAKKELISYNLSRTNNLHKLQLLEWKSTIKSDEPSVTTFQILNVQTESTHIELTNLLQYIKYWRPQAIYLL